MNISQIYITVAIVVLAVVAFLMFIVGRHRGQTRLTPLAGVAFGLILAGIFFGENRFVGYGLMAVGVTLAIIDLLMKKKSA